MRGRWRHDCDFCIKSCVNKRDKLHVTWAERKSVMMLCRCRGMNYGATGTKGLQERLETRQYVLVCGYV